MKFCVCAPVVDVDDTLPFGEGNIEAEGILWSQFCHSAVQSCSAQFVSSQCG